MSSSRFGQRVWSKETGVWRVLEVGNMSIMRLVLGFLLLQLEYQSAGKPRSLVLYSTHSGGNGGGGARGAFALKWRIQG